MLARLWGAGLVLLTLAKPSYFQFFINTGRISTDEFRLIGGSATNEGRLQIRHADPPDGAWSTVCADQTVDVTVAFAICARMGYKVACDHGTSADFDTAGPNADLRPIEHVSFAACELGPTQWELDCNTVGFPSGSDTCSAGNEDVWLRCASDPGDLELRLADPLSSFTGILQARCRGSQEWSSICSGTSWDIRDADVACRHLGFSFSAERKTSIFVSNLDPASVPARVFISEFGCAGNEPDILQCQLGLLSTSCTTIPRISCGRETSEFGSQVGLCGNRNLCGTECAQQLDTNGLPRSGCHCDDACMALGDCCYDYQMNCNPEARDPPTSLNGLPIGQFGCVDVPGFDTTFDGYYLVNACPDSWLGSGVRDSCQLPPNSSDVLASIPVYNNITVAQYKNIYCAICHGEIYDQMTPWTVKARYSFDRGGQPILPNFDVVAPAASTFTGFFVVSAPVLMIEDIRRCSAPIIDTCFEEYRGSETERGCKGYAAAMTYRPSAFSGPITNYRNPYCGKCNNVTLTLSDSCGYNFCELLCNSDPLSRCFERCARGEDFLTLDVLFQFQSDGNSMEGLVSCVPGEIYDPFIGGCRLLTCSPGYEVQNQECVKVVVPSTIQPDRNKPMSASFAYHPNNTFNVGLVDCLTVLLGDNTESIVYWDASLNKSSNSLAVNFLAANETAIVCINSALYDLTNSSWCNVTQVSFFLELVSVLPVDLCLDYYVTGSSLFQEYFRKDESSHVARVSRFDFDSSVQVYTFSEVDHACLEYNLTCPSLVTLNSTEFAQIRNGNETVVEYIPSGRVLPMGTYVVLGDGRAVVCADFLIVNPTDELTVTELAYRYLYLVLTVLSLVALAVTFIVYSLLPKLRNLAGQCIMNLVAALFTANLLLVLNGYFIEVPAICLVAAPVIHLTWLAAFVWMTVLSFNVAHTITSKVVRKSDRSTTKKLLLYMLSAWGTSLLIVCICIALHFCQCAGTGPIYASDSSCYIVNSNVNLYAFGIPVALALTIGISLFIFTVVNLRLARVKTRIARNETRLQEAKVEFVIYVRLSVLMGLSWIFGFLTQVVPGYGMLFVFVILNSLQGVLIFLSFCSTARVRGLLSERYKAGFCSKQRRKTSRKKANLLASSGTHSQTQNAHSVNSDTTRL